MRVTAVTLLAVLAVGVLLLSGAAVAILSSTGPRPPSPSGSGTSPVAATGDAPHPQTSPPPAKASPDTPRVPDPALPPPSTAINGSVHVNGSLAASTTYLDGDVHIVGSAVTSGLTESQGWADYGGTMVTGSMSIHGSPGATGNIFASNPGSSLYVNPSPANSTGFNVLQGNIEIGDSALGQTFHMYTFGVNITIEAGAAGGFYSYGTNAASIDVANFTALRNYANSSGSVSIDACVFGICLTDTVAPGAVFLLASLACVPLLGCLASIPTESITWPADTQFTILGQTNTTGNGMTALLPDSRMDITVPEGTRVNISMTPQQGSPQLTVGPGSTLPALVVTQGRTTVSQGEEIEGTVVVNGTFAAGSLAENSGTFYNAGGLSIQGELDSAGEQLFRHKLQLGPQVSILTSPEGGIITQGPTSIDDDVQIDGSTNATGNLTIIGTLTQNATLAHIQGNLSLNGSMVAEGSVATDGTTAFQGFISSSGDISLPHAFMNGSFVMSSGSFVGTGTTLLTGSSVGHGWTWVNATTYSVTGAAWLNGTVDVNRSISVVGDAELLTAPGGALRLTANVLMGKPLAGAPWTSRVEGSVLVRGASYANGTSTFNGTTVVFPNGIKVVGTVEAQGNVSVQGTTAFLGAVTSSGSAQFPGMSLSGTFALSAEGGLVNGTGTSGVAGNVTLVGTLKVDHGVFEEFGVSTIDGDLSMTGTVVVSGDSTLATAPGTTLALAGNIDLAGAAHVLGNVNSTGNVTIRGSATLSSSEVNISGSLSVTGSVYSRGTIELTGTADFLGAVYTQGRTDLPGLSVAGNYTLRWGEFRLDGEISLTGFTVVPQGTVTANSSGYFVDGPSRIVGYTQATGSVSVWGESFTVGYVTLGDGATFGGYMVVNGGMTAGGIPLSGRVVLPNDSATFSGGANITGTVWQVGLLQSQNGEASFYGQSIVNGTVSSPTSPNLQGAVVADVFGSPFALSLGAEFVAYLAGLAALVLVAGVELLRIGWKHRTPFTPSQRRAVEKLKFEPLLSIALLAGGGAAGGAGGYGLGASLVSSATMASSTTVTEVYLVASALLWVGIVLWVHHRFRYHWARTSAPPPSGTTEGSAFKTWAAGETPSSGSSPSSSSPGADGRP